MFSNQYYTLVAGLREWALDADTKGFDARAIIDAVAEELSAGDAKAVKLLYTYYDIENLLTLRRGGSRVVGLGNLSAEQLAEEMEHPEQLPQFAQKLILAYARPEDTEWDDVDKSIAFEKAMFEAYYNECAHSSSGFLREWAAFDKALRNVSAAVTARRLDMPVAEVLVGDDEIVQGLTKSSAADFGLKGELPWIDTLLSALGEDVDMLDKEHRIDLIRWEMSEELTAFDYFNIDAVLAYLVRINLVDRWSRLDGARGKEMYQRLVSALSARDKIENAAKAE
ncbi:MAG: DUF2764 family protein [Rikenellaceae bacterium]|nr:DUF2764 family protein [Rikenellaceae bacterium]